MKGHRVVTGIAAAALALLPRPAVAQPVRAPSPCEVDIVYAPDAVRAVVAQWVHAEPACRVALEARIIPTDGGFYLVVLDERGQVRERIVPDATSAAVLIASWAADDSILSPTPSREQAALPPSTPLPSGSSLVPLPAPPRPPPAAPALDVAPAPPPVPVVIAPAVPAAPAVVAVAPAPVAVALVPTAPPVVVTRTIVRAPDGPIIHRISLAAFSELKRDQGDGRVDGLRLELELWKNGIWSAGTALSTGIATGPVHEDSDRSWSLESTATGFVRPSVEIGPLRIAPTFGVGVAHSYLHDRDYGWHQRTAWQARMLAEASLGVSVRLGRRATIAASPMVGVTSRPSLGNARDSDDNESHTTISVAGGLEWVW